MHHHLKLAWHLSEVLSPFQCLHCCLLLIWTIWQLHPCSIIICITLPFLLHTSPKHRLWNLKEFSCLLQTCTICKINTFLSNRNELGHRVEWNVTGDVKEYGTWHLCCITCFRDMRILVTEPQYSHGQSWFLTMETQTQVHDRSHRTCHGYSDNGAELFYSTSASHSPA